MTGHGAHHERALAGAPPSPLGGYGETGPTPSCSTSDASGAAARAPARPYGAIAEKHAASRDAEARISTRISRLRLATFLPAAACLVWMLARGVTLPPLAAAVVLFSVFGALVVWHARVEDRVACYDALRLVNLRNLARIARDWDALPAAEALAERDLSHHPYALDLDLFGRASLSQWLGPAATPAGGRTLAGWLLEPAGRIDIVERQHAVSVLADADEWREHFSAHGVLVTAAGRADIARFLEWAEGPDPLGRHAHLVRPAVLLTTAAIWLLVLLHAAGVVGTAFWLIPVAVGLVLSFGLAHRVSTAFDRAGGGQYSLARYAGLLEDAVLVPDGATFLAQLRQRLSGDGATAPQHMRRLNRILGFADLRRGAAILHFPIQAMTLWDFHVLSALERWRIHSGRRVRDWFQAVSELDALAMLAGVRRDNPEWCFPEITSAPEIYCEAVAHPLIPSDRRVPNDVTIGPPGTVLLITGSNMSGKSTLLRAVGLNIVLAQAGGCVCARQMRLPESDVQTCMRVQDSLELGLSYFMAALARLKGVVDAAEHARNGRTLVYLLDEILQGTNSAERAIAVRAVARHLLKAGAIGVMTTHDVTLAGEEPLKTAARLVHFTETVDSLGVMQFDYRLRPGVATSRNALRLMQLIGIGLGS